MPPLAASRLYTFIDAAYLRGRSPAEVARQLCAGGSDLIQLRAKNSPRDEVIKWVKDILPITRSAEVNLVINDHPEIALELGAEFCHLGQEDFFDAGFTRASEVFKAPASSPSALRPPPQLGLSTHAPEQARRAIEAGADYIAIGPVFPTGTKPTAKAVTLEYVRWAAENVRIPWFAIGGIHLGNLDAVLEAGARRICVVSAILNAPDIAQACKEFKSRLLSAPL